MKAIILAGGLAMIPHTDVGILTQAARHAKDRCWVCGRTARPGLSVPEHGAAWAAGVINNATGGVDIVVVWEDSNIALPVCEVAGQSLTFDIGKGECLAPGPARPEPCETWKA